VKVLVIRVKFVLAIPEEEVKSVDRNSVQK
jgi:hypothetical protein